MTTVRPGESFPLGVTWDGHGINVAVYSEAADFVEMCLFDDAGRETRLRLPEITRFIHHGYIPDVGPGSKYGFRVHGPWVPAEGLLCNPAKLLLDPYARAVSGRLTWDDAVFGYLPAGPTQQNPEDSARFVPRSVVVADEFDWGDDSPIRRPLHDTLVYEAHVKGLTALHRDVPPELRGTYAALGSAPVIGHLRDLGFNALVKRGLRNYWGYNSIGFFAPHAGYSASGDDGGQVIEFKQMVKNLHEAGIEVILDVVYNHTAEGNHLGPTLSLKGLDNRTYYRLAPDDPSRYVDYTGTGNSLDVRHPETLRLIMDSLRYWIQEMHVDGFRFDLAAALARGHHDVDRWSAFLNLVHQDPVVSRVKLIAEPWDVGENGYQVGNFPPLWSEWNGRYRDGVRDFWRGADEMLGDFAYRITGSSDLYAWSGRRPSASINFITAHDGFTLADLVVYEQKQNEANGDDNRDGESHNRSWNSGVEGPTDDPATNETRRVRQRSMLATLLLSQGVPMVLSGDEIGRSQQGNNNAYCQDNEISWVDWGAADHGLLDFFRNLARLRSGHRIFRRRRWFEGRALHGEGIDDIRWFAPDGSEMTNEDWQVGYAKSLAVLLNGDAIPTPDSSGEPVRDDSFMLMFNAGTDRVTFSLADEPAASAWVVEIDTGSEHTPGHTVGGLENIEVGAWAMVVLRRLDPEPTR
jgi:glycogen operon protein